MHRINKSMTSGPLFGRMMLYTIPIIITGILQLFFHAADLIIVGRFGDSGSNAVAAVGCTGAISNLIVNFFIGCSAGGGVVVAHAVGAGNKEAVHRAVHVIIPFAALGGAVISVLGIAFSKPMLELMSTPENIIGLSDVYMKIIFAGMMPNMIYNFGASILRAVGESKKPLLYLAVSGVINIILNCFFVIVLHFDVAGVALATVISQLLSAVMIVMELTKRTDDCRLELRKIRFYAEPLKRILRIGIPAGIQSSLFAASNVIIQSSINSLETLFAGVVAGNAAAANIQGFALMANEGFKQTAMNFTGQNVGCGNYRRVRKIANISLLMTLIVCGVVGVVMTYYSRFLLGFYISDSPEAVHWGAVRMMYTCLPCFVVGVMDVASGLLRGMGRSVFPMLVSVFGICIFRIVWIYTVFQIPAYHTPECLWISYLISWALTFLVLYVQVLTIISKKIRESKENN